MRVTENQEGKPGPGIGLWIERPVWILFWLTLEGTGLSTWSFSVETSVLATLGLASVWLTPLPRLSGALALSVASLLTHSSTVTGTLPTRLALGPGTCI